jgi:hypothetical protein
MNTEEHEPMHHPNPKRSTARAVAALLAALAFAPAAQAVDLSLSGYATLEVAQSNRSFGYQRYIDEQGTLKAGSLAAVQADLRLNPQWSATVQLKAAPSLRSDTKIDTQANWAFVAWRPSDEWLLRLGQMRVPLFLYSESSDIGVASDLARLPREVYALAPSTDFSGAFATWSRSSGADAELTVEAYYGKDKFDARFWARDGLPPVVQPGANYNRVDVRSGGLIATWRSPSTLVRAGLHSASTQLPDGMRTAVRYPFVPVAPGLGYYQVNAQLPGPGVETTDGIRNTVFNLGAEQRLGGGWRVAGEFSRIWQHRTELGSSGKSGYVAVFKELGGFTPYVALAAARSDTTQLDWYRRLTTTQLPAFIPGAAQINGAQRLAGESIYTLDQDTLSLGSSYSLGKHGKLKLEWARTKIGEASRLVDTPPGQPDPANTRIDVLTLSYSVAF